MDFGNSLPWTVRRPKRGMSHQKKETQLWLNVALPTPILESEAAEAGPETAMKRKSVGHTTHSFEYPVFWEVIF